MDVTNHVAGGATEHMIANMSLIQVLDQVVATALAAFHNNVLAMEHGLQTPGKCFPINE